MAINFNTDSYFNFTATLIAVTDTHLWVSAECTNGASNDCHQLNWSHGTRDKSLTALKHGMGIEIGDVIRVEGRRNYWPVAAHCISWSVLAKES